MNQQQPAFSNEAELRQRDQQRRFTAHTQDGKNADSCLRIAHEFQLKLLLNLQQWHRRCDSAIASHHHQTTRWVTYRTTRGWICKSPCPAADSRGGTPVQRLQAAKKPRRLAGASDINGG